VCHIDQRAVSELGTECRAEKTRRAVKHAAHESCFDSRRKTTQLRRAAAVIVLAGALAAVDSRGSWEQPRLAAQTTRAELVDLKSTAALRQQFNDDRDNIRLVLLLSPT